MPLFLIVHVLDSTYSPLDNAKVEATFDGVQLGVSLAGLGAFETPFPGDNNSVVVKVTLDGFFPVEQTLKVVKSQKPTFVFDGDQKVEMRNIDSHSRDGGGFNLEVFVVLLHIRDALGKVNGVNLSGSINLTPGPLKISKVSTPILNADPDIFLNVTAAVPVTPGGKLFFVERTSTPRLIAIYVSNEIIETIKKQEEDKSPITLPYHLFFSPNIPVNPPDDPTAFHGDYPFSKDYVLLVSRYLLQPFVSPTGFVTTMGKALVHQLELSGKPAILIFPVGGLHVEMGDLPTKANLHRLLPEVNYWLQRTVGVKYPLIAQPVGHLALSGFSSGIRRIAQTFAATGKDDIFYNTVLKEVYSFDGAFVGPSGKAETADFCNKLTAWFRAGADSRVIRVYTQSADWLKNLKATVGGTPVPAHDGGQELEGSNGTVLLVPTAFWRASLDRANPGFEATIEALVRAQMLKRKEDLKLLPANITKQYNAIGHQLIPARFFEHAAENRKF